ncbi:MAG: cobalamin-dependent protein [Candidatus Obscuribacterales bacterium]|nr:cobalamin-dependent protein [Candidatus Obscuribacterales bacterium]
MKILLCSVFGPYGVDDEYGRRLNVMELFHNQVTREQGVFSLRMNHPSFGLYLIAENLEAPTVVLDFPSFDKFKKELENGYDYVGISFITSNFIKAKVMAEYIRERFPACKIILGGHGTGLPGIEEKIPCDYVCRGEGIKFFRELLGEENRELKHPSMKSALNRRIMGFPIAANAAVLIPGLGCVNACRFCATSHHFQKSYLGFLNSGPALFQTMSEIESKLSVNEFFVMDENFLKNRIRAEELIEEMEKHNKYFHLGVFSSAETINAVGVEFLVRLGIDFVWIGVESKREIYTKTRGVDLKATIKSLRNFGIQVLGSGILFLEHHDRQTIFEDIEYLIGLETDFVQFMELGPLPGTALYEDYAAADKLRLDVPFEDWHGQDKIWFKHEHFTRDETAEYTKLAFQMDYQKQGPSLLRLADTSLRGYRTVRSHSDSRIRGLTERLRKRCLDFYPVFPACRQSAENDKTRELLDFLELEYRKEFGAPSLAVRLGACVLSIFAYFERLKLKNKTFMYQPPTIRKEYRLNGSNTRSCRIHKQDDAQLRSAPLLSAHKAAVKEKSNLAAPN